MKTIASTGTLLLFSFLSSVGQAWGMGRIEEKAWRAMLEDPAFVGEPVKETSQLEKDLFTEYQKRRTPHFFVETSRDADAARAYAAFCEWAYGDFLRWAGKDAETYGLWNVRAHVAVIANRGEWESLMLARNRDASRFVKEKLKKVGGQWSARGLFTLVHSRGDATLEGECLQLFHTLNHLFLHGLAKSGPEGCVWWLWEAFSMMRGVEVFGAPGPGCTDFKTGVEHRDDPAWRDPDAWVRLLKVDVRMKQDEPFVVFRHKDVQSIRQTTYVKAWSILRYLTRGKRERAKFVAFLERLKTKGDQDRALQDVLGMDAETLDGRWRRWVRRQRG